VDADREYAFPGIKGFNRRGLYRMKQFYETYKDNEIVTPLVTQINWTNMATFLNHVSCKYYAIQRD